MPQFKRTAIAVVVSTAVAPRPGAGAASAQSPEQTLPEVKVKAAPQQETGHGPVQGYRATRSETATKTDTPIVETPQSISVVTRERMTDLGVLNVQEAMRYLAGVRSDPYGMDTRGDWSIIRGTEPQEYLDGMRRLFNYYNNVRPDPYTLERVEVLKGPSSVLYGQVTPGGLVNLVSKRPQAEPLREVEVQIGNYNRRQIAADLSGPITKDGEWLYRLVMVGRQSDTQVDFVPDDRSVLAPSFTWQPSARTSLTLQFNIQNDDSGSSTAFLPHSGTLLPNPNGKIPTNRFVSEPGFDEYDTAQKAAGWLFEHKPNETWTLRQNLRYTRSKASYQSMYPDVYTNPAAPYVDPAQRLLNRFIYVSKPQTGALTTDTQAQAKLKWGETEHTLLFGFDYMRFYEKGLSAFGVTPPFDVYAPVYGNYVYPALGPVPVNKQRHSGFYVQDQVKLDQRWIVMAGLRRDDAANETVGVSVQKDADTTGRAGLMYQMDGGWSPYVSYSESFLPQIDTDINNVPFKPTRGKQKEIGVKYQAPGTRNLITASVYDLTEQNRLLPDPTNPLFSIQGGEAKTKGLELEAVTEIGKHFDLIASYTYTDLKATSGFGIPDAPVAGIPKNMAAAWGTYKFAPEGAKGRVSVGAGVRYVGETTDETGTLHTPDVTLFDAMVAYDTGPWRFALNGTNLADKTVIASCLQRGDCFYGSRRNVVATARYRF